ncbi:MAG: glycosyl hydrolase family 28-related protein [bacterium]|nr:glycosyl hydrolase family 28-related protein [bacterium]
MYIRGNLQVGQTVTAHVLDGDIVPAEVQYQWKADGNPISSATQKMYRLQQNDYGKRISVTVNFTDLANNAESATSTVTNPIGSAQPNHTPRWLFVRNGTLLANKTGASVGEIVVQDPDPQDTHSYRVSDARFEVRENILKLKDDQRVDYTREQKIILSIEVTDSAGASFIRDDITLTVQENTQSPLGQKLGVHVPAPMTSFVANVKDPVYGAKGDGVTDDTVAIQKAIDAVHAQGGGIVEVPAGTYMIDAVTSLKMKSNVILRLNDATILKVIPNEQQRYALLSFHNVDNAHLLGGSLQGDRANHRGTAGERGMGVDIRSATNIVIENTIARDFW